MSKPMLTLEEVRRKGLEAVARELGPVDYIRFIQMFSNGKGDYTAEREELLKGVTIEDIIAEIKEREAKDSS